MRALQAEISGMEFAEWQASELLDPPEEDRADVRHAQLMTLIANVSLRPRQPYKPDDFLIRWDDPMTPEKRAEEALAVAQAQAQMRAAFAKRKPN